MPTAAMSLSIGTRTSNADDDGLTDAQRLRAFVKTLPPRAVLRHHVAGDIGKE
jgi:hypothetical protein